MAKFDIWDAALIGLISLHLAVAPYTKVEESFNTQAIYDFVNHGLDLLKFDHLEFPGAVPRSFVGSLFYGYITRFFKPYLIDSDTPTQIHLQLLARGLLGLFNGLGFIILRHAVIDTTNLVYSNPKLYSFSITEAITTETDEKDGKQTETVVVEEEVKEEVKEETVPEAEIRESKPSIGFWFAALQFTQFHLIFYSSRFLPNFLALPLTNIAFAASIRANYQLAFAILAFTSMVFRFEISMLLASLLFTSVIIYGKAPIFSSASSVLFGASVGGLLSFFIDSKIWNPALDISSLVKDPSQGTIPEISSFIFNVLGKNAEKWGVEPFGAYFTSYFRRIFFPPAVISMVAAGLFNDPTKSLQSVTIIGISSLLHVLIMSFQPHKEWRFIAYDIPGITLAGAAGIAKFHKNFRSSFFSKLAVLAVLISTVISLLGSLFMLYSSSVNYPGGIALDSFNKYIIERYYNGTLPINQNYTVHLDILPKMTGATLFGELQESYLAARNISLSYDKSENHATLAEKWSNFDFLITDIDASEPAYGVRDLDLRNKKALASVSGTQWYKVDTIKAFAGITPKPLFANQKFDPKTVILQIVKDAIEQKSVDPVLKLVNEAVVKVPAVYIYEKQHLA